MIRGYGKTAYARGLEDELYSVRADLREVAYQQRPDGSFYVSWLDTDGMHQERIFATFAAARRWVKAAA